MLCHDVECIFEINDSWISCVYVKWYWAWWGFRATIEIMDDPELDIQVQEIRGDDGSYKYSFTYERATMYEFKYERKPHPDPVDPCYRCYRRIWDKEQMINVGVLFHKACFRCRICGLPLTMHTFHRNDANGSPDKEVYCKTHVGKGLNQIQQERAPIYGIDDGFGPSRTETVCIKPCQNLNVNLHLIRCVHN